MALALLFCSSVSCQMLVCALLFTCFKPHSSAEQTEVSKNSAMRDSDDYVKIVQAELDSVRSKHARDVEMLMAHLEATNSTLQRVQNRLDQCACAEVGSGNDAISGTLKSEGGLDNSADTRGAMQLIDVSSSSSLDKVLFGGSPWVVYCVDRTSAVPSMDELFSESAEELASMAAFGEADCWRRTATGKTLAHRLDLGEPPQAFAVANGDSPVVVDLDGVRKPWQLRRKVASSLRANITAIHSAENFKALCTSRAACVMIGFKTAMALSEATETLTPLLEQQRGVRAVAVNTSVWKVKLDDALTATKPKKKKGQKDSADVVCVARQGGDQKDGGSFLRLVGESVARNTDLVRNFLDKCARGEDLVTIKELPQLTVRPPDIPKYSNPYQNRYDDNLRANKNRYDDLYGRGYNDPYNAGGYRDPYYGKYDDPYKPYGSPGYRDPYYGGFDDLYKQNYAKDPLNKQPASGFGRGRGRGTDMGKDYTSTGTSSYGKPSVSTSTEKKSSDERKERVGSRAALHSDEELFSATDNVEMDSAHEGETSSDEETIEL